MQVKQLIVPRPAMAAVEDTEDLFLAWTLHEMGLFTLVGVLDL